MAVKCADATGEPIDITGLAGVLKEIYGRGGVEDYLVLADFLTQLGSFDERGILHKQCVV